MTNIVPFEQRHPLVAQRGIDEATWSALQNSVYPGAKEESILMVTDYCRARHLDPLLKPVHIVPMNVKNSQTNNYEWRDVVMPGIGMYRIQADRSGSYAGSTDPEFGPLIAMEFKGENNHSEIINIPEWCKITVHKLINGTLVAFSAKEMWLENYATAGKNTQIPNAMWKKRPYAQLAKCAEAQALRKAWPEIGQQATAEEMEGKDLIIEHDVTPSRNNITAKQYPAQDFEKNFPSWRKKIESGRNTPERIIAMVEAKGALTEDMKQRLLSVNTIQGETTHASH
ncbi:phage recombination protein Bet [Vibrio navarrensis]|uniref:Phage recombination protein Bet n=1 Tax=Vibrio navarrensis TaxID=29495 RepID=A0AAJ4I8S1_9VIBR|nr:phage recombination protein Bet [Vibrio navarrensis]MBE3662145.1 phage recombination protein Bet [Vibrio navarrensis]QPL52439.1 phage recombination protein Bet [Vibrio navarrensis]